MRKINYFLITVFLMTCFMTSALANSFKYEESIKKNNPKLYEALLENTMPIDADGDGRLSNSEIKEFSGNLILTDKGLTSINGLEYFKSVTNLWLDKNYLTDLKPLYKMDSLFYAAVLGNNLDITYKTNHNYLKEANKLLDFVRKHKDSEGTPGNISYGSQTISYDASKITNNSKKYKVLYVILKDINSKVPLNNGTVDKVKYTMNNTEIELAKQWARLFEQYVEKITDYKIDIDLDVYVTNKTLTALNERSHGLSADYADDWGIFGEDIPEIANIIEDYDSSIVIGYLNEKDHVSSQGGFSGVTKRGHAFYSFEEAIKGFIVNNEPIENEINDLKRDKSINGHMDGIIHEFIHTLEYYSCNYYEGGDCTPDSTTWEFHDELRYFGNSEKISKNRGILNGYEQEYHALYLNGEVNPKNTTQAGIRDEVWSNPPTKYYSKGLATPSKPKITIDVDAKKEVINLKWEATNNTTVYKVYKSTAKNGVYELIKITKDLNYTDKNAKAGTKYFYKVVAVNQKDTSAKRSANSNIVNGTVPTKNVEKAPKVTITKGNNNSISLTWNKVTNATKYSVLRSTSKNGEYELIKDNLTKSKYTDKRLKYGTKYYYKVIAKNDTSEKTSKIVNKKVVPNTVDNLKGKAGNKKITLSWNKVSASGYEIWQSTNNKDFEQVALIEKNDTLKYVIKKLKAKKKYFYKVRSYKIVNGKKVYGDFSSVVKVKTK